MDKARFRIAAAAAAMGAALVAGCGGGSSAGGTASVTGTVMAGPFLGGQVCAYRLDAGSKGARLGCAPIDAATSAYALALGAFAGDVVLEVSGGARYDDEADPADNAAGTAIPDGTLRSFATAAGGATTAAITPLTELVIRQALAAAAGQWQPRLLQQKAQELRAAWGLPADLDVFATQPVLKAASGVQLGYREALRALSQLQYAGGTGRYAGNLGAHLDTLVPDIVTPAQALRAELAKGLAKGCAIGAGNVLACTDATGTDTTAAPGALTCAMKGGVAPTPAQLATFAATYTGDEGKWDQTFNFTRTGPATLVFAADGALTYNGKAYTPTSICHEDNATYGAMLYLQFASGSHLDLFAKDKSWTGESPADPDVAVSGMPASDPAPAAPTTVTLPSGSIVDGSSVTTDALVNVPGGRILTFRKGTAAVTVYDYVTTLGIAATDTGLSLGVAPSNGCALEAVWVTPNAPLCSSVGIAFDRNAGTITFTDTPMHAIVFTCPGDCRLRGGLAFAPS